MSQRPSANESPGTYATFGQCATHGEFYARIGIRSSDLRNGCPACSVAELEREKADLPKRLQALVDEAIAARATPEPRATRTPADYAIEHGEYLATTAEGFMNAMNAYDKAVDAVNDNENDDLVEELEETLHKTHEARSDYWQALGNDIYEFRKRAERAKRTAPETKAPHLREPPHCPTCNCEPANTKPADHIVDANKMVVETSAPLCDDCGKPCTHLGHGLQWECLNDNCPPANTKPAETAANLLSDLADDLIRKLHARGMVTMQVVFDGAVLRVQPE